MKCLVWNIYIILIALAPVSLMAQEKAAFENVLDSLLNPPMLGGEAVLKFARQDIYVGKLSEDDAPSTYCFEFTNISKKAVFLTKVVTSCGCTVAEFDKAALPPGGKRVLALTFNPNGKVGTIDTRAFVYTNLSTQKPVAKIGLRGEVLPSDDEWNRYPCVMGALRLKRNTVLFPALTRTAFSTERMVCANSGKKPLRLSALMIPAYASFRTEPKVILPGTEADIVIKIDGTKIPAAIAMKDTFNFSIILDGLDVKPSERTIQVKATLSKVKHL